MLAEILSFTQPLAVLYQLYHHTVVIGEFSAPNCVKIVKVDIADGLLS